MAPIYWSREVLISSNFLVTCCVNLLQFVFLNAARIIKNFWWDEKQEISLVWPYHAYTQKQVSGEKFILNKSRM